MIDNEEQLQKEENTDTDDQGNMTDLKDESVDPKTEQPDDEANPLKDTVDKTEDTAEEVVSGTTEPEKDPQPSGRVGRFEKMGPEAGGINPPKTWPNIRRPDETDRMPSAESLRSYSTFQSALKTRPAPAISTSASR